MNSITLEGVIKRHKETALAKGGHKTWMMVDVLNPDSSEVSQFEVVTKTTEEPLPFDLSEGDNVLVFGSMVQLLNNHWILLADGVRVRDSNPEGRPGRCTHASQEVGPADSLRRAGTF